MARRRTEAPARERLTWAEICTRYPDEWVTLIDLEWTGDPDDGRLAAAVVLGHSKKRGDSLRETRALRDEENIRECAHWFTGPLVPPDFVSFRLLGL